MAEGERKGKYRKLTHTVYQCNYHIVWVPKYRYRVLEGPIREAVEHDTRVLCSWRGVEVMELATLDFGLAGSGGGHRLPPRLVLIADGFTDEAVAERAVAAAEAGVRWVHLRDHGASAEAFGAAARRLAERLRRAGAVVSVNARADVARRLGAGLHLGRRGLPVAEARQVLGEKTPIGFSAHDFSEGEQAVRGGADYLFFSPIFPTMSKPEHPGAGLDALASFCAAFPEIPVFALGGATPERVAACREAGAYGVAVLSGLLHAPDPQDAARRYLAALQTA